MCDKMNEYQTSQIESKLQNITFIEEKNDEDLATTNSNSSRLPDLVSNTTTDSNNSNDHPTHLPNWKYKVRIIV